MESGWVLNEDEALELLAFLVTAARTQVDEAPEYGPMRLVMAAQHLSGAIQARVSGATGALLSGPLNALNRLATPLSDPDGYARDLDSVCRALAAHLRQHFATTTAHD